MGTLDDEIRSYWEEDAATYDLAPQHRPTSPAVLAAWTASLHGVLPPAPARVLDCGAGTGFLSLLAARLGHRVTALELAPAMLERLRAAAGAAGLVVDTVEGRAEEPPAGEFDVVMERHLLWTLPDPVVALRRWREAAPGGALVLVESLWGGVDAVEQARGRARGALRRVRGGRPEHHAEYAPALRRELPLGAGTHPDQLVRLVEKAGWRGPRLHRLRDVEWAERLGLAWPERMLGVSPRFLLVAGARLEPALGG
ncbi:MAG TPA: class I SAM-dependent methyltransferase [Acidimicrobiales bacterium]|nr:class I SAM-dependent methyltransferase [Acidimicrobiales bacterium]